MASTRASNSNHNWSYDVFMSFGGDDGIIKRFVDHLFTDFKRKGIRAFKEDEHLLKGEERCEQVYRAIEESRFLVVIFSESFSSSPSCLRELVKILECKEKENDRYRICPIFYKVKAEKVVNGFNRYAELALREVDMIIEVARWKEALTKAAYLPGWDLEDLANGYESKFIDMISKHIFNELNVGWLHTGEKLVGIHSRVEQMNLLQYTGSSDQVHMMGICGVHGIGKTSIAQAVYNQLYAHFDDCIFCEDVKEFVKKHGLIQLQRQIIEDMTKADRKIRSVSEGSSVMKQIMASKRVLLILDDVGQLDHLEALAGSRSWFGAGSLIIVTGEDRQLLRAHGVEKIHQVEVLDSDEALELFSLYAFNQKDPKDEELIKLCEQVIEYANGHPLALKELGCFLFGKSADEWISEIKRLEANPTDDIQLLISRFSSTMKRRLA